MDDKRQDRCPQRSESGYSRESYARKTPAALRIALLLAVLIPLALCASAYTPGEDDVSRQIRLWLYGEEGRGQPVGGLIDVEDAWAIEDARTEAQDALVTRMFSGDRILGFDRESRTFYCTLGTGLAEEWPEIALSALGGEGVSVVWIDDYAYDFCRDAVAEGYRYELLAYTDAEYAYIGVVFTGLPVVTIHVDGGAEIVTDTDVGADVHIASAQQGGLYTRAQIHKRGGGAYVGIPKDSYRLECRSIDLRGGEQKIARSVLGMEADSDWLLIANASDPTAIRNHLCWQLWKDWQDGPQFAELESRLVEVFRDDEYVGVYQLMQYVNPVKELVRMGGDPQTDALMRMITLGNVSDRPQKNRVTWDTHKVELRYAPDWMDAEEAFALYAPFDDVEILRTRTMSDEEFAASIERHFDVRELIDYFLFIQMYGLTDNVRNNLYVWALRGEDGTYAYRFSPWDMDQSLGSPESRIHPGEMASYELEMVHRMLDLDLFDSRRIMWERFDEKRAGVLSDDAIYQWIDGVETEINATGAYLRESERWRGGATPLDLGEMRARLIEFQELFERNASWMWPRAEGAQDAA